MGTIRRGTISQNFIDGLKLDVGNKSPAPNETSDKVVLTYDYSNAKYADIAKSGSAINATSGNLLVIGDEDFYLTGANLSMIKDATSTSTYSRISCTINGGITWLPVEIVSLTLTAQDGQISQTFSPPVKLDRNQTITITNSTNVANISARGSITGFFKRG